MSVQTALSYALRTRAKEEQWLSPSARCPVPTREVVARSGKPAHRPSSPAHAARKSVPHTPPAPRAGRTRSVAFWTS